MEFDAQTGLLRYYATEPDEEDLRSFLLLFRHFISDSEPIFISRIFSDCIRFLIDEEIRGEVNKARESWKNQVRSGWITMQVDDTNLTPEYVLDLWINGHYFHDAPDKGVELTELLDQPISLVRMQFLITLPGLTNIILYMGHIISHCLEKELFHIPSGTL